MKKEAERREFEKQALIFPEELVHEVEIVVGVADDVLSGNCEATTGLEPVEKSFDEAPDLLFMWRQ